MDTPQPVNLLALKNILANAKKVMQKVESDKPSTPTKANNTRENISESSQPIYDESDEREPIYENQQTAQAPVGPRDYTAEQVMASNLPDSVKQLMIAKPIPVLKGIPSSFTLEDVIDKPKTKKPVTQVNENRGSNMITVSQDQLQKMIDASVANYFKADYEKRITEAAIKKTINVLIKEGKLNVKKKTL